MVSFLSDARRTAPAIGRWQQFYKCGSGVLLAWNKLLVTRGAGTIRKLRAGSGLKLVYRAGGGSVRRARFRPNWRGIEIRNETIPTAPLLIA